MSRAVASEESRVDPFGSYDFSGFGGGMRNDLESTQMGDTEYLLAVNLRNRLGKFTTIKNPLQLTLGLPVYTTPSVQGIYGVGSFILVIIKGKLYYRNFADDTGYFRWLRDLSLDENVTTIYAEMVPASSINFDRVSTDGNASGDVVFGNVAGQPSPQALIVMDGVNQAIGVFPNGSVFKTQTFDQWNLDSKGRGREYVPVGIMPLYVGGILYIVSPDRKEIYRSVEGRPLDFVVAITADNGNKITDGSFRIEASRLAIRPFFEDITCIARVSLPIEGFFASTLNTSSLVVLDRTNLLFGEPKYTFQPLFPTGAVNQFSIIDNLGDTAFVDISGVRSFNSVQQFRLEGRNAPFTKKLSRLFVNPKTNQTILQFVTCATEFDNYSMFSMDTIYGPAVLLYDTLTNSWASIDVFEGIGKIVQFAQVKYNNVRRLFFITEAGNTYEAFASETTANWKLYPKEWVADGAKTQQKTTSVSLAYQNALEDGEISVTDFMDSKQGETSSRVVVESDNALDAIPLAFPFGSSDVDKVKTITCAFPRSNQGWKIGAFIQGNSALELLAVTVSSEIVASKTTLDQQASTYAV